MAKTKHQKLADQMQAMRDAIDEHGSKVKRELNLVQLHFYEPYLLLGRPLMKESALRGMFVAHYLNLQHLATDWQTRQTCQKYPMLGTIVRCALYRRANCKQSHGDGTWMVPWKVRVIRPDENQKKLKRGRGQAFLYCPNSDEISNQIDWFEKEMAADSLTYQFLSMDEYHRRWALIYKNYLKDPFPIWAMSKEAWLAEPTEESNLNQEYDVPQDPTNVDAANFAPKTGDSLALAYESVMRSIRTRRCRHRAPLLQIYKRNLEEALFEGSPWNDRERKSFLQEWKDNFFGTERSSRAQKPGRWKQCEGVDDVTASRFLEHFTSEFIANPKNKKLGEIACVLWILLWIAQEGGGDRITIKQVLQLSSQDIATNDSAIIVDGIEVTISWGLRELLFCLRGHGEGKRACRLFKSLDLSGKSLERAMIEVSNALLPEGADPVLPASFLISPHVLQGTRMSSAERATMRNVKPLVPLCHTRKDIKRALLSAQARCSTATSASS